MANLVSPGVSVTVTTENFYIPATALTVPLIFIATADQKTQDNTTGGKAAAGTFEYNVIRTVTSLSQSHQLYGIPRFLVDSNGSPLHGDCRNEYGLLALNQYLNVGARAYVVRANVNLNDNYNDIVDMWDRSMMGAGDVLESLTTIYINEYNQSNGFIPGSTNGVATFGARVNGTLYTNGTYTNVPLTGGTGNGASANITVSGGQVTGVVLVHPGVNYTVGDILTTSSSNIGGTGSGFTIAVATLAASLYKETVTRTEVLSLIMSATESTFKMFSFRSLQDLFMDDRSANPLSVYMNGFGNPPVGTGFIGIEGMALEWEMSTLGSVVPTEWTPQEAYNMLISGADSFKYTREFMNGTSLGANDGDRRSTIYGALNAIIDGVQVNTDVRSEIYEFNIVLCPGFAETANSMRNLNRAINEEALVIGDVPFMNPDGADMDPEMVSSHWGPNYPDVYGIGQRQFDKSITYYYPHGMAVNQVDPAGANVFCAGSGIALATIAWSDQISEQWIAPAGTRRGVVTAAYDVGYISGLLGTPTTFVPTALNQGQRDALYITSINPIVSFPGRGIIIWGQKTSAPVPQPEDRINVTRLVKYVVRSLRKNTMSFVFEPNDQLTRDNLKSEVDGFLGDLIVRRGLYDFATVCSTTNNTPDRIDRNELWIDVALKPVKAAEFIMIPIKVVATGTPL